MTDRVIIFDTTLRDGEQALKASLTVKEKLQIALALERLGVDVMKVGFPVSSQGDLESVQTIACHIKNSRVAALSRAVDKDIDVAYEALKVAEIHTFIASSALHVEAKLKRTFDDVVEMAVAAMKHTRNYTDDVQFSCEDAGRTGIDNICRIVEAAINADHYRQYSRHRRLLFTDRIRQHYCSSTQPRTKHRQSHYFRALPQRLRHGDRQLFNCGTERCTPN